MASELIVLTGMYQPISKIIHDNKLDVDTVFYGNLLQLEEITEKGYLIDENARQIRRFFNNWHDLEMERDNEIGAFLRKDHRIAFVEQWHVGNIAWATQFPGLAESYEDELPRILKRFSEVKLIFWFVSSDLEKLESQNAQIRYKQYLSGLSQLSKQYDLKTETIDGEATEVMIESRVSSLLQSTLHKIK